MLFTKRLSSLEHALMRRLEHLNMLVSAMYETKNDFKLEVVLNARENIVSLKTIHISRLLTEGEETNKFLMEWTLNCYNAGKPESEHITKEEVVRQHIQKQNALEFVILPFLNKLAGNMGN